MTSCSAMTKGACPICGDTDICIIADTGRLRRHKHGNPPCAGSYGSPVGYLTAIAVLVTASAQYINNSRVGEVIGDGNVGGAQRQTGMDAGDSGEEIGELLVVVMK